jgi:ABC-type nitrate/sulfonate/bicarbonate transport system substrate-binding protein
VIDGNAIKQSWRGDMSAAVDTAPVRLAIISEGVNAWPLYAAQGRKLFEQEGVAVKVTLTGSSSQQLEQLRSGGYDIGFQQSDHVVRAVETGSDLCIVMAQGHAPELSLVVAPGIKSFADLRGRAIAVDGANSGYALVLRRLLAEHGLQKNDYSFLEIAARRNATMQ